MHEVQELDGIIIDAMSAQLWGQAWPPHRPEDSYLPPWLQAKPKVFTCMQVYDVGYNPVSLQELHDRIPFVTVHRGIHFESAELRSHQTLVDYLGEYVAVISSFQHVHNTRTLRLQTVSFKLITAKMVYQELLDAVGFELGKTKIKFNPMVQLSTFSLVVRELIFLLSTVLEMHKNGQLYIPMQSPYASYIIGSTN